MYTSLSHIPTTPTSTSKCIIMLHGVWSNEEDLFALAPAFSPEDYIFSLRGVDTLAPGKYAWYRVDFSTGKPVYRYADVERGYESIVGYISDIAAKYSIRSEQIYLLGFSQGAIMSSYTLWRSPEKIAGIITLSWRILTEIDTSDIREERYEGKRIFIWHGVEDSMISVTSTGGMTAFARALSIEPTLKFYNAGHTITREELTDVITWL